MLSICVGPNGSGKSLWALHQLIKFLREDKRVIVTSLALHLDRLNEYLQRKYGEAAPDVYRRVVCIGKELQQTFWRVRGIIDGWTDGQEGDAGSWGYQPLVFPPFGQERWKVVPHGVIYILDEIQTCFGAREWQKTGPEFVAYQSQHRHFGDDTIAISPASALIDKQFRILAGECIVLSNFYKLKVGIVKAPRHIIYRVYQNCPPAPGEDHMAKGTFTIDGPGLASCYNTAAGMGLCGVDADKGKESKGLPFWSLFVALGLAGIIGWYMITRGMRWAVNRGVDKFKVAKPAQVEPAVVPPSNVVVMVSNVAPVSHVKLTGVSAFGVCLSDGRVIKAPAKWVEIPGGVLVLGSGGGQFLW